MLAKLKKKELSKRVHGICGVTRIVFNVDLTCFHFILLSQSMDYL